MDTARITSKGQVTIPISVRKALGVKRGDILVFQIEPGGGANVRAVKSQKLSSLYGSLPATRPFPGKEETRKAVGEALAQGERRDSPEVPPQ